MKTLKLHTALKLKNRLAGEVSRLQSVLQRENSRRNDNTSKVNRAEIQAELITTRNKLLRLKAAIAAANVPIYHTLASLEEAKAELSFYSSLPIREGVEIIPTHTGKLEYTWDAFVNREGLDNLTKSLQLRINDLQDEADSFNSSTSITVDV